MTQVKSPFTSHPLGIWYSYLKGSIDRVSDSNLDARGQKIVHRFRYGTGTSSLWLRYGYRNLETDGLGERRGNGEQLPRSSSWNDPLHQHLIPVFYNSIQWQRPKGRVSNTSHNRQRQLKEKHLDLSETIFTIVTSSSLALFSLFGLVQLLPYTYLLLLLECTHTTQYISVEHHWNHDYSHTSLSIPDRPRVSKPPNASHRTAFEAQPQNNRIRPTTSEN